MGIENILIEILRVTCKIAALVWTMFEVLKNPSDK